MALLRRRLIVSIALLFSLLCSVARVHAATAMVKEVSEHEAKAAMLVQFSKFVEWPANRLPTPATPFIIGVVGDDAFGDVLDRLTNGQTVAGHPILVKRYKTMLDTGSDMHVLFVSRSEHSRLSKLQEPLFPTGILMVGDDQSFAQRVGTIGFVRDGDRIRFEINVATAERCGLKISSRLLALAKTVVNHSSEARR